MNDLVCALKCTQRHGLMAGITSCIKYLIYRIINNNLWGHTIVLFRHLNLGRKNLALLARFTFLIQFIDNSVGAYVLLGHSVQYLSLFQDTSSVCQAIRINCSTVHPITALAQQKLLNVPCTLAS